MKICLLIIAVAALCCAVDAAPKKRSAYGDYGTQAPVVSQDIPIVRNEVPVVSQDIPVASSGYGAKVVETPVISQDIPVASSGYGGNVVETPVPPPVHTESSYGGNVVETPVISQDIPVASSGYGAKVVETPVISQDIPVASSGYGGNVVETPVISQDIPVASSGYGGNVVETPVPPPVHTESSYGQSSYGSHGSSIAFDASVSHGVEVTDPALINMCTEKRIDNTVFYLPHPTRQSWFIQCDLFGKTYLKECPQGTIFTLNLVCENPADLHPVEHVKNEAPIVQMDQSVGSYGSAPVFQADLPNSIEVSRVEILREAPEFRELCMAKMSNYGQVSTIFYIAHPSDKHFFIQCDEFGKAFLKECPMNLIFTLHLVCERPGEIVVEPATAPVVSMDIPVGHDTSYGSYGSQVETSYGSGQAVSQDIPVHTTVEVIREAPEFKNLCLSKGAYGLQSAQVFYIQHPTDHRLYIQCDEFGKAFLKECPVNTIFTANLVCEKLDDLHPVEHTEVIETQPQLDTAQSYGSYGAAPSFALDTGVQHETVAQVEVVQEAPEFNELCLRKGSYGSQVSTDFYLPHPTNKQMYIQCNEFGKAFLKTCPTGTIFTRHMTCEKIDEIIEEPVMMDVPVTNSYAAPAVQQPIAMDVPVAHSQSYAAPPRVEEPIMMDVPATTVSYGNNYAAQTVQQPVAMDVPVMTHSTGY